MTNQATQPKEDKQETNAIAEQFLLGALIDSVAIPFQSLSVPWLKMSEKEQTKFRDNIIERASEVVKKAVICIATGDRVNFRATCEQVQFKADGVKAALTLNNSPEAHALADVAGGNVLIVVEDGGRYLGTGDAIQPQPDIKPLFDEKPTATKPSKTNVIDVTAEFIGRGSDPIKTAKLGELPNDAGIYICEPDEKESWEHKNNRASYSLIELENGKWVYGNKIMTNDGGLSFSPSASSMVNSREEAIEAIRESLEDYKKRLTGKPLESFTEFVDWLGQDAAG